MTPYLLALLRS